MKKILLLLVLVSLFGCENIETPPERPDRLVQIHMESFGLFSCEYTHDGETKILCEDTDYYSGELLSNSIIAISGIEDVYLFIDNKYVVKSKGGTYKIK